MKPEPAAPEETRTRQTSVLPVTVEVEAVVGGEVPRLTARGGALGPCLAGVLLVRVVGGEGG